MLKTFYMHLMLSSIITLTRCQQSAMPKLVFENSKCREKYNGAFVCFGKSVEKCGKIFFEDPEKFPGNYFKCLVSNNGEIFN